MTVAYNMDDGAWSKSAKNPGVIRNGATFSITEVWSGSREKRQAFLDSLPRGEPHPVFPDALLDDTVLSLGVGDGDDVRDEVELRYSVPTDNGDAFGSSPPPGHAIRRSSAGPIEVPLTQHPLQTNIDLDGTVSISGVPKPGKEAYLETGITYQYIEVDSSWSWTQAKLTENMHLREAPKGLSGADANKWLRTGLDPVEDSDGNVAVTISWTFSPSGWDTDIYGEA